MGKNFTEDIAAGRDLSVDNFLIKVAKGLRLFSRGELADIINAGSLDEFLSFTTIDNIAKAKEDVERTLKKIEIAEHRPNPVTPSQRRDFDWSLSFSSSWIANMEAMEAFDREVAGALYDSLPRQTVSENRSLLLLKEPHEMGDIFGEKYRAIGTVGWDKEIVLLEEIAKEIRTARNDPHNKWLLTKKALGFYKMNTEYLLGADEAKRARYDGMTQLVKDWLPIYSNPRDCRLESDVLAKLRYIKYMAAEELGYERSENCYSKKCIENITKYGDPYADQPKYDTSDKCLDTLYYRVQNRIDLLSKSVEGRREIHKDITRDIATGRDLSVDNFLIAVAKEGRVFPRGELSEIINAESRDEFVSFTGQDVSHIRDKIAQVEKRLAASKGVDETEAAQADIAYYHAEIDRLKNIDAHSREFAGALYDNLPDRVVCEKRSRLQIKQDVDNKSAEHLLENDAAMRARYEGMLEEVEAWNPVCENAHVQDKLEMHKRSAMTSLIQGESRNCYSEEDIAAVRNNNISELNRTNQNNAEVLK